MFKSLGRLAGRSDRQDAAAALRRNGDLARDAREWVGAATQYEAYLRERPKDAAIWIQLGHARKEAGDVVGAESAYSHALQLTPGDADLLLNIGHLHKLQGRTEQASAYYARSVAAEFNEHALRELVAMRVPENGQAAPVPVDAQAGSTDALQALCRGLIVHEANDISVSDDASDTIRFAGTDPWVRLTLNTNGSRPAFGALRFALRSTEPERPTHGKLYVDYGEGFGEKHLLSFSSEQEGDVRLLLVNPAAVVALRWDPDEQPNQCVVEDIAFEDVATPDQLAAFCQSAGLEDPDLGHLKSLGDDLFGEEADLSIADTVSAQYDTPYRFDDAFNYDYWRSLYATPDGADYRRMDEMIDGFATRPRFSFVMPVYDPPVGFLAEIMDAMLGQNYPDFEICVADDASTNPAVRRLLESYALDERVKLVARPVNGHISAASNSALDLATGDYVVLVDHDDLIPRYCLFVVADYLNRFPNARILYSDEDKIDTDGKYSVPYFKSNFNKFLMYGHNQISHLGVYATDLVKRVGGFRKGLEGSQDYDLFLRCYEQIGSDELVHIPHVLYHWRTIPGSTAIAADQKSYALIAAQGAINGHFERSGLPLRSIDGVLAGNTAVRATREHDTSISIIIPTKDGLDVLKPCIRSIEQRPHENVEILVVDNMSSEEETRAYLEIMSRRQVFKVIEYPQEFNYSVINNVAVKESTGDILCFLNNDTEVISDAWLERARALLSIPEVGIVGARLLFPDRTLQHFGIATGMGEHGVAGTIHHALPADASGYFGKAQLIAEFTAVTAACLFIRRDVFEEVGGFEPSLRVAFNDIDLCLKVRSAGYRILVDPQITLTHKESKTRGSDASGPNRDRLDREAALMHERWPDALANDPYWSPNLSLMRSDFAFAYPPRVLPPWMSEERTRRRGRR